VKKKDTQKLSLATRAVHTGEREGARDFLTTTTPIYQTASYVTDTMEQMDEIFGGTREGFVYTRYGNPTVHALEEAVASLEGADAAIAFGSGMAAINAALLGADLGSGDDIVASRDIYGATHALLTTVFPALGIRATLVDITDLAAVERALEQRKPKVLYFETISNPLMRVADLPALVELGHKYHATVMVDATFTPPVLLRPLEYGADVVLHSATKYLSGHGDTTGGVVSGSADYISRLAELIKLTGGILGPHDAWLILRGIKTLPLRVREQCRNAARIAETLSKDRRIAHVYYPGLETNPQHELTKCLLGGEYYGAMLAFDIANVGQPEVFRFFEALKLCVRATTLGDVYTLLLYPAQSSHRALSPAQRQKIGIGEGLVRLSAGIEDVNDILADLEQALRAI
jgi:cystathionine gamma-synthase/methionine-gamma-lyase